MNQITTDPPKKQTIVRKSILDRIAISAINAQAKIIPVGKNKGPLIPEWQSKSAGSYDKAQLENWRIQYQNPYWGLPCGPVNGCLVFDVDLQKDKKKRPIGMPLLGPVDKKNLQVSFSQQTQSVFKGVRGWHGFYKWEDKLRVFNNSRFSGTTIDIRTERGQVVLYRELPPYDIWSDLNPMPDALFETLKTLLNVKSSEDWRVGNRNNTLFKKIALDLERNQGRNIPAIIEKSQKAGLGKAEIKNTTHSAIKSAIKSGIEPPPTHPQTVAKKNQEKITLQTFESITDLSPPEWHAQDWLPKTGVVLLTADKATGKTALLFLIAKALTSGEGWTKSGFFKTKFPISKGLFLYGERSQRHYGRLWNAHNGDKKRMALWRWSSEFKKKRDGLLNWELKNIRQALKDNPDVKTVFMDRADWVMKRNEQFDIRDSMGELDEISYENDVLFIITRHTSKPVGLDARQFKEKTSGYKEWQHAPSICLFLHAHEGRLLLFKVYANECSQNGLIEFEWKNKGGIFIPQYKKHNPLLTIGEIESLYNKPQFDKGKREQKIDDVYSLFENKGKSDKAFRPGTQDLIPVYVISKERAVKEFGIPERTIYWNLTEKLGGWSKTCPKVGALWHCPKRG